jgi:cyclase
MESKQRIRVIPVLSIVDNKLVKTVKFNNPRYIGDPLNAIKILNEKRVDELVIIDITASKEKKEPNYKLIEDMASEAFMPLAYGGGIHSFSQAAKIFSLGVEKVILNSALYSNKDLISEIASVYGNQSVVVSLDIKKNIFGNIKAFFYSGTRNLSTNIEELIQLYIDQGAGELIIHSIDRDGTFSGFDVKLIEKFSKITIPVVALGGCNSIKDMIASIKSGANAIAAGSFFVYRNNDVRSILVNYPNRTELKEIVNR